MHPMMPLVHMFDVIKVTCISGNVHDDLICKLRFKSVDTLIQFVYTLLAAAKCSHVYTLCLPIFHQASTQPVLNLIEIIEGWVAPQSRITSGGVPSTATRTRRASRHRVLNIRIRPRT